MKRRSFLKSLPAAGVLAPGINRLARAASTAPAGEGMDARHLLITYAWGTADIGGIGIVPGLLSLLRQSEFGRPAIVVTCQGVRSSGCRFLKGYLPRYLPGCGVHADPFGSLLDSADGGGVSGAAWRAFSRRWGPTKLREFENGSLSAKFARRMADDVLNRLSLEAYAEMRQVNPATAQAFADAGFLLYTSGTMLNFGREGHRQFWTEGTGLRYSLPLFVARALKIPYGVFSHSFDAVEWPVDLILRPAFKDAQFVFCRDTDSLEYLRQRDLLNASSGFRPDSTFFFDGRDEEWAKQFLKTHGLKNDGFLTVTGRYPAHQEPVLAALAAERERGHLEKWKGLIEGWIERTGLSVLICPETKHCMPRMRERLFAILSPGARRKCVCMDTFWTPEQACSVFRRARVVTGHMHTMIFALSVGTPVLHIQYAEAGRKAWMVSDVGLGDWLYDLDEATGDELLQAALQIHAEPERARRRVQHARQMVQRLGMEVLTEIKAGWRRDRDRADAAGSRGEV